MVESSTSAAPHGGPEQRCTGGLETGECDHTLTEHDGEDGRCLVEGCACDWWNPPEDDFDD